MRKYGGTLIHKSADELGVIEVVEGDIERSLHFGTEPKQSSMERSRPTHLALSYTRAMTSALLFTESPRRVLVIGLGGGSLAKFFLHHFPRCRVDAVEYREAVFKVACGYFGLAQDHPRLRVHLGDAREFAVAADPEAFGEYDLILVDAFDARGIAYSVCGQTFLAACRNRLASGGTFAMNLWSGDSVTADDLLEEMRETFPHAVLRLPVHGKDNVIGMAIPCSYSRRLLRQLEERAGALEARLDVEYPALLRALRKGNGWRW